MEFTVIKAKKADLPAVVGLAIKHLQSEGKAEPRNRLRKKAEEIRKIKKNFGLRSRAWFLVYVDGKPIGLGQAEIIDPRVGLKRGKISFAYVEPKFRRRGVGTALTQARLEWLKKKKINLVETAIRPSNMASHANLNKYKLKPWLNIYTFKI